MIMQLRRHLKYVPNPRIIRIADQYDLSQTNPCPNSPQCRHDPANTLPFRNRDRCPRGYSPSAKRSAQVSARLRDLPRLRSRRERLQSDLLHAAKREKSSRSDLEASAAGWTAAIFPTL